MKKYLFLGFLLSSFLPFSVFGQDITISSLQKKFSAAYIQEYNLSNFENDIGSQVGSDGIYKNSIQSLSKESTWDKSKFNEFVSEMKNKNMEEAKRLYSDNWQGMSPFLPTCCAFKKYTAFKNLKNGILALSVSGNGAASYRFEYIFYANNRLFSITGQDYFIETTSSDQKNMLLIYKSNPKNYNSKSIVLKSITRSNESILFSGLMQYWFDNPSSAHKYFRFEYNKFLNLMTTIWK